MPTRPKLSRILFVHLAAAALLACASAASAAGSSFLGMGSETGTPTGDVRAAIEPRLHTLPVPEWVSSAKIDPKDLFRVPNPPALRRPVRIGVQASLGETSHAPWLAYTLAEIRHALGERNVRIYWLDDHSIALGAKSRQLDFFIADSHVFVLEQSMNRAEEIAAFKPSEADLAEEAQASVLFVRKDAPAHVGGTRRIVSLENLKAFRFTATTPGGLASWLAAEGWVVTGTTPVVNIPNYPDEADLKRELQGLPHVILLDAEALAREAGSPRSANMALLGATAPLLGIEAGQLEAGIRAIFARKGEAVVGANLAAFRAGYETAQKQTGR